MTDTAAKATKSTKAAAKAAKEDAETFGARLTDGTREFVKRSTETAKERTDSMYDASKRYNEGLEDVLVRAAKGYTDVLSNVADAAYANVNHTFATAEKLAEAKSISEAAQIQSDFVREQASHNMENVRSAFDYLRDVVSNGSTEMREAATKMWNGNKAA
ncbi:MAG: phasin family protein [Pseudomonadota bacterium]